MAVIALAAMMRDFEWVRGLGYSGGSTMNHEIYESPLVSRNASAEMLRLFSPQYKFSLWRKLWLELARAQRDLGLDRISEEALQQMQARLDDIDFELAARWEKRLRHDVMAHVHTFEEAAPAAKGIIHLGATSQYVVDNADLILMESKGGHFQF